jgi:hypothetical protein
MLTQPSQIVGHSTRRIDGWVLIEQFRHLDLENRQFIAVTRRTLFGAEWMRETGEPLAEHRIDFFAIERITEFLQTRGILAGQQTIVQGFEANAFPGQLTLDSLMTVDADFNGIGKMGTKADE